MIDKWKKVFLEALVSHNRASEHQCKSTTQQFHSRP